VLVKVRATAATARPKDCFHVEHWDITLLPRGSVEPRCWTSGIGGNANAAQRNVSLS
jgi:hypothetical protein